MRHLALLAAFALIASVTNSALADAKLAGADSPLKDGDRIVFLGDSITAAGVRPDGYVTLVHNDITKSGKKVEVIGAGVSGNRVPNLQARLQKDVIDKKPTIVWIYIGINDVWHSEHGKGTPKAEYEAGLKDIIAQIQKAGAVVVLATPTVIGEKTDGTNKLDKMLDEYADVSRSVAKETGSTLCDLHKVFGEELKKINTKNEPKGVLTADGVHLSKAGNILVAAQADEAIAAAAASRK